MLNSKVYPSSLFKELYAKRWGVETFYDELKNKLKIEH
ncbi:transposase, partial [Flavivirga aquimarina]